MPIRIWNPGWGGEGKKKKRQTQIPKSKVMSQAVCTFLLRKEMLMLVVKSPFTYEYVPINFCQTHVPRIYFKRKAFHRSSRYWRHY